MNRGRGRRPCGSMWRCGDLAPAAAPTRPVRVGRRGFERRRNRAAAGRRAASDRRVGLWRAVHAPDVGHVIDEDRDGRLGRPSRQGCRHGRRRRRRFRRGGRNTDGEGLGYASGAGNPGGAPANPPTDCRRRRSQATQDSGPRTAIRRRNLWPFPGLCKPNQRHTGQSRTAMDGHRWNAPNGPYLRENASRKVVARTGIEPVTPGFSVLCSTS